VATQKIEITDEMIEEQEREYRELQLKSARQEGFSKGRKEGERSMIEKIENQIQIYKDMDKRSRELGINMHHASNTRRINILQEMVDDLRYIYGLDEGSQ